MQTSNFKGVVYLSKSDYDELVLNGSITKSGQTLTYDSATLYVTDDDSISEYSAGSTQWDTTPTQNSTKAVTSGGVYNYVNSSVNNVSAYYVTKNASGAPFDTKAVLDNATTFYSGGVERVPTTNDYCVVLADISQAQSVTNYSSFTTTDEYIGYYVLYNNLATLVSYLNRNSVGITAGTTIPYYTIPTTRYSYHGSQWEFQYIINNTSFTVSQLEAINSGITADKVAQIDENISQKQNTKIYYFWAKEAVTQTSNSYTVNFTSKSANDVYVEVEVGFYNMSQADMINIECVGTKTGISLTNNYYAQSNSRHTIKATGLLNNISGTEGITTKLKSDSTTTYNIDYVKVTITGTNVNITSNKPNRYMVYPMLNGNWLLVFTCDKKIVYKEMTSADLKLLNFNTVLDGYINANTDYMLGDVSEFLTLCKGFAYDSTTQQYSDLLDWVIQRNETVPQYSIKNISTSSGYTMGTSSIASWGVDLRPLKSQTLAFEMVCTEKSGANAPRGRVARYSSTARSKNTTIMPALSNLGDKQISQLALPRWKYAPIENYTDLVIFIVAGNKLGRCVYTGTNDIITMTEIDCDRIRAFQIDADNVEVFTHYNHIWTRYLFTRDSENTSVFNQGSATVCLKDYDDIVYINDSIVMYTQNDLTFIAPKTQFIS